MAYSAVKAIGVRLMQRVLADFPKLKISLSESHSGSTLLQLLASEVDLAMVYNPPQEPRRQENPQFFAVAAWLATVVENGQPISLNPVVFL